MAQQPDIKKVVVITESAAKSARLQQLVSEFSGKNWKFFEVSKDVFDCAKTEHWLDDNLFPVWSIDKSIHNLKKSLMKADEAYICTDLDAEGEALAYQLQDLILKHSDARSRRIAIDELCLTNLTIALTGADIVDSNLAKAHFARLVIDKLVMDELKPFIKRAGRILDSKGHNLNYNIHTFSVLGEIVKRERERRAFTPQKRFYVEGHICKGKATGRSLAFLTEDAAKRHIDKIREYLDEEVVEYDYAERSEVSKILPPFTTSTILRTMSAKHGWKPRETLQAARLLYDSGVITYYKTNRVAMNRRFAERLWVYARAQGLAVADVTKNYSAPGYGEVIRPTGFLKPEDLPVRDRIARDLYEMVWNRTISTQLQPAVTRKQEVDYLVGDNVIFYAEGSSPEKPGLNAPVHKQTLEEKTLHKVREMTVREESTQPPARHTVASAIKWMDENAIGRPHLYVEVIENLIDNIFVQEQDNGELTLTARGEMIYTIIEKCVVDLIDPVFCAQIEEDLEDIISGRAEYTETVKAYQTWLRSLQLGKRKYTLPYPTKCPSCKGQLKGAMDHKKCNPYVKCTACTWWNFISFDTEGQIVISKTQTNQTDPTVLEETEDHG
jgi:DNA topoisomerase-1